MLVRQKALPHALPQGPRWFGCEAPALSVWSLALRVCFMNVSVMNWNIQGIVSFQGSSGKPWQFCPKERGIPLNSPIMQILNLTCDPPEVWCPVKEEVTSNQVADSKDEQREAKSGALSSERTGRQFLRPNYSCYVLISWRFATNNKLENNKMITMMMRLTFIEDLLCSRHSAELFMWMTSLDSYNSLMSRYYTMGHLTDGETETQNLIALLHKPLG